MESEYPELTFSLTRREAGGYRLDLRFGQPGSQGEVDPAAGGELSVQLDLAAFEPLAATPAEYGRQLSAALFAPPAARDAFRQAQAVAASAGSPLRMRLQIGPEALELHRLHWETLYDPDGKAPLFNSRVLFSRYLTSDRWSAIRLGPQHKLRALVAVSNPSDLDAYSLEPVDVDAEIERARQALAGIEVEVMGGAAGPVTLDGLSQRLRQGRFDIVYLVAHGMTRNQESFLWLQTEQGETARMSGTALAEAFKKLDKQPLLAVLLACESARQDAGGALIAAGPLLAAAGVPAVLAMQARISMETGAKFMPVFFADLLASGIVDHAAAVGRDAVREQPDAWMPVLFTRLKSGAIYGEAPLEAQVTRQVGKLNRSLVWIAAVVILLLLGITGFVAWQSKQTAGGLTLKATATPSQMTSNFNVAIAEFDVVDQNGSPVDSADGRELAKYLFERLPENFANVPLSLRPEIWPAGYTGKIEGKTPADRQAAAEQRTIAINAHVLIYGQIVKQAEGGQFSPEFVVNYKGFADNAPEVTGSNLLGKSLFVDLPFDPVSANTGGNPALEARSNALGLITIGLAYYAFDDYINAQKYFSEAIGLPNWLESDGKELAYLLHGNAISRQASIDKEFTHLPEAQQDYAKAWSITQGSYGRALVGQGGIVYLEALTNPLNPTDKNVDREKLAEAEKIFNQALALKNQPASYNIPSKANFSLGQVYQVRGQILGEPGMIAEAIKSYEKVTKAYECSLANAGGTPPAAGTPGAGGANSGTPPAAAGECSTKNIQELASFAYARLGLLNAQPPEPNYPLAIENYQKSFNISSPYFKSIATFSKGVIQLQMAYAALDKAEPEARIAELLGTAQQTLEQGVQRAQTLSKQEVIDDFAPFLALTYLEQGKLAKNQGDEATARQKFETAAELLEKNLAKARFKLDDPATTWYEREDLQAYVEMFGPSLAELQTSFGTYLGTPAP